MKVVEKIERILVVIMMYLFIQLITLLFFLGCYYVVQKDLIQVPIIVSGIIMWIVYQKKLKN